MSLFGFGSDNKNGVVSKKILGLPLGFTELADPFRRIYNMYTQEAILVSIIPGRPKFRPASLRTAKYEALLKILEQAKSTDDQDGWTKDIDAGGVPTFVDYYDKDNDIYEGKASEELSKKYSELPDHDKEAAESLFERDLRFYSFDPAVAEFRRVVNILLNEVGGKMSGISFGNDNIEKYVDWDDTHSYGLHFCAEASTTVSESFSSELGESALAGMAKGVSAKAKEAAFLLGISDRTAGSKDSNSKLEERARNSGASSGMSGVLSDLANTVVSGFDDNNRVGAVLNGENLLFPKVWQNSTFDKSYNISFRFLSPYGDKDSIFEYVYVPFLCCMAMCGPVQTATDSFKSPFLVRINCPGIMECDMGMVTNISWVRGTSQNLYSCQGLPLGIDVTMTVTDMYPTMALASNLALLRENMGLSAFLDNMCGLSNMKMNLIANVNSSINSKIASGFGKATDIYTSVKDWAHSMNFFTR